jgi:hypothetical protein
MVNASNPVPADITTIRAIYAISASSLAALVVMLLIFVLHAYLGFNCLQTPALNNV